MTAPRSRFKRQESWRLKRVKENWRRPRGVTSRMRKEKNGWPSLVKVGHGSDASKRGRHPKGLVERIVRNESDLEGLDPKVHIVRLSAHLGEKRRLTLVERARSLNVHIANPGKREAGPVGEEPTAAGGPASIVEASPTVSDSSGETDRRDSDRLDEADNNPKMTSEPTREEDPES
jgi:large subunit ribosomal protein L32e